MHKNTTVCADWYYDDDEKFRLNLSGRMCEGDRENDSILGFNVAVTLCTRADLCVAGHGGGKVL